MNRKNRIVCIFISIIIIICIILGLIGIITKKIENNEIKGIEEPNNLDKEDKRNESINYLYISKKSDGEYCLKKTEECDNDVLKVKVKNQNAEILAYDNITNPTYTLIKNEKIELINIKEKTRQDINLNNNYNKYEFVIENYSKSKLLGIKYKENNKVGFYGIEKNKILLEGEYIDIICNSDKDVSYINGYTLTKIDSLNLNNNKITIFENDGSIPLEIGIPQDFNEEIITALLSKGTDDEYYNPIVAFYNKKGKLIAKVNGYYTDTTFYKFAIFDNKLYTIEENRLNVYSSKKLEKTIDITKYNGIRGIIDGGEYHNKKSIYHYFIGVEDNKIIILNIDTEDKTEIAQLKEYEFVRPYIYYTKIGSDINACEKNNNIEENCEYGCSPYINKKATKEGYYIGISNKETTEKGYEIYFNPQTKEIEKNEAEFCSGMM